MRFEMEEQGERGTLFMEGELTIKHAGELKEALLDALNRVNHLYFSIEDVTSIDLSCLQLLCAAHRTATLMDKEFSQSGTNPEAFEKIITNAGYPRSMGCTEIMAKGCLWTQSE